MLAHLRLINFRNYDRCAIDFSPGINYLLGANGQGKTNILEAVYYLSLLRSFRTSQINNLRQWQKNVFHLSAECVKNGGVKDRIAVSYGTERRLAINGVPIARASDFINRFICATFIPEDLDIIKGPACLRRRFLDITISQLSPAYLKSLQNYSAALKNRNIMLKQPGKYPLSTLTAYDCIIVKQGVAIELARRDLSTKLNLALQKQSEIFFRQKKVLSLKFLTGLGTLLKDASESSAELSALYHETLQKTLERDCREGNTRYGPHRSELHCLMDNNSLAFFGSEGECRAAALALRFACLDVLQQELGREEVTLIVDDVLGELDQERRRAFLQQLDLAGQVLIAGTAVPDEIKTQSKVFSVVAGQCQAV